MVWGCPGGRTVLPTTWDMGHYVLCPQACECGEAAGAAKHTFIYAMPPRSAFYVKKAHNSYRARRNWSRIGKRVRTIARMAIQNRRRGPYRSGTGSKFRRRK